MFLRLGLLCLFLVLPALRARAEFLVSTNSAWNFRKGTNEVSSPVSEWRKETFDDSAWPNGPAPFYYGENLGNGTVLGDMEDRYTSIFLRRSFDIEPALNGRLELLALYDDGFIAWINGREVARVNMPLGEIPASGVASTAIEPVWTQINLGASADLLHPGLNVLAVQVFNRSASSSDLVFDAQLTLIEPDVIAPRVSQITPPAGAVSNLAQIEIVFSEPVVGVSPTDLLINNQPTASVSGTGASYIFSFTQPAYGIVDVTWEPGHDIFDLAQPPNPFDESAEDARWSYNLVDAAAPVIAVINPPPDSTVRKLSQIEIHFNEPVRGVDAEDLLVNDVPASAVTGSFAGPYFFSFAQPTEGTVRLQWAASHGISDYAQPANAFTGSAWTVRLDPNAAPPPVFITEFLSATLSSNLQLDEDGELQDWIELHNAGSEAVSLAGWSLSDEADEPGKWIFPPMQLGPGQYLVVFASAKDRRSTAPGARLHTNFKLNAAGEYLGLFSAESPRQVLTEFAPQFPEQRNDYSYGTDSAGRWRYFQTPTPGRANGASSIDTAVPQPHFSVGRGFFDAPFRLFITCALPDAIIRYTLDGSEPSQTSGIIYSSPLLVSNTTVLRAAAFKLNALPSTVATATYIFPEAVLRQPNNPPGYPIGSTVWAGYPADYEMDPEIVNHPAYAGQMKEALLALPTLSIVCKREDMFGAANGIYTHPLNRGPSWERPCSVELIFPDGRRGFQVNAGVQIQGNAAREPQKQPKHPMRLVFKGDYGPAKLEFPMFPDSPVEVFDTLVLRADFNGSWLHWNPTQRLIGQRIRDAWTKDSMRAMGGLASHNRYVHLYINGLYWGIYDPTERPDGAFGSAYLGGQKEEYDVVNEGAVVDGTMVDYNAMLAITGLQNPAQYQRMQQYLDLTQFIDYMLLHFYIGHQDWGFNKNWYTLRKRGGPTGFKYVPWDGELILDSPTYNRVTSTDVPSGLHTKLLASPEYRLAFADRVRRHFFNQGALTSEAVIARWNKRADEIELPIIAESARWGDYRRDVHPYQNGPYYLYTRDDHWMAERNRLLTRYFPNRTATVLNQLKSAGLYPSVEAPSFNQHGGSIAGDFELRITAPAGTIFYTLDGADPRVPFTGAVHPGAQSYSAPIPLSGAATLVKARVLSGTTWSALTEALFERRIPIIPLTISEIMFNPIDGDTYEFIELHYAGRTPLDLGGMSFSGIDFVFPTGTIVSGPGYFVLAPNLNPAAFAQRYPGANVRGFYGGNLSNGGERLVLRDANGRILSSVDYDDQLPWPLEADGSGYSLERTGLDPDAPENWRRSYQTGGTPGRESDWPAVQSMVRIHEFMAANTSIRAPDGQFLDWIELHNSGSEMVSLAGWSLSDDSNARKLVFPPETAIGPGQHLVVWSDRVLNASGLVTGFALNRNGDQIFLYDARTNRVSGLTFGPQVENFSLGLIADDWVLMNPTPGAANDSEPIAGSPRSLALNEWLANPVAGEDDWIELFNRDTIRPVELRGLFFTTSLDAFQIASHTFIAPGGHVRFWTDAAPGADHVDFRLPAEGTTLSLLDEFGDLLDRVSFPAQAEGISQGRMPDGAEAIVSFPQTPSPGASNYLLSYSGPLLNEIMARNFAAWTNASGSSSDWVELFHPGDAPFALEGMSLSFDEENPGQWFFPAGVRIQPKSFLVIACDHLRPASVSAGAFLNSGRSLDGNSGAVYLFNSQGQRVDFVEYGPQIYDQSIGRVLGQPQAPWFLLATSTPGESNSSAAQLGSPGFLRMNEWLANSPANDDWVELFNPGSLPVALDGLILTDDPSLAGKSRFRIGPLSFIAPRSFVQWIADDRPSAGQNHLNFALHEQGETLRIYDAAGQLIDGIEFGAHAPGISEGRLPDGSNAIVFFPNSPTPGRPNQRTLDRDNDGLPDDWEQAHGLDPDLAADASIDSDADGQSNFAEYVAGTDPRQAASSLAIEVIAISSNLLEIQFQAVAGRAYTLESRAALESGLWEKVLEVAARPADWPVMIQTALPAGQTKSFYRIVCTLRGTE
ncbi:MAG: lamin tail domain-containing protein [Verrucomicrobiota bacterium]